MADLSFDEFLNAFKKMLINRYFWSVNDAYHFDSEKLKAPYHEGLDRHHAYFKIFNIEQYLIR
jgi:hypothetical protein